jgi:hypothetical protein
MDEYLFITLARLKADRLQLEREQRRAESDPEQLRLELAETRGPSVPQPVRNSRVRNSIVSRWFSQQPSWRGQS